jgi:hypothetical protein
MNFFKQIFGVKYSKKFKNHTIDNMEGIIEIVECAREENEKAYFLFSQLIDCIDRWDAELKSVYSKYFAIKKMMDYHFSTEFSLDKKYCNSCKEFAEIMKELNKVRAKLEFPASEKKLFEFVKMLKED